MFQCSRVILKIQSHDGLVTVSLNQHSKDNPGTSIQIIKVGPIPTIIDETCCDACGTCLKSCRYGVYEKLDEKPQVAHIQYCKDCGVCIDDCPNRCITFREEVNQK